MFLTPDILIHSTTFLLHTRLRSNKIKFEQVILSKGGEGSICFTEFYRQWLGHYCLAHDNRAPPPERQRGGGGHQQQRA